MTNVYAPWYSERTEDPSEGLMTGSNNTFIYTAPLCECNSWRKSKTAVLETTIARRERRKSHKEVCFAALPISPCSTTRINFVYRKKMPFLLLCMRQIYAPPLPFVGKAFVPVVPLGMTQEKLSLPFQYTLATTWSQTDERRVFLQGPFYLWFLCWNC